MGATAALATLQATPKHQCQAMLSDLAFVNACSAQRRQSESERWRKREREREGGGGGEIGR